MKNSAFRIVAAGLLLSGVSLVQAQGPEPSHLLRIDREDVKPGKGAAHERVESSWGRAEAKGGAHPYIALESMTGPDQALFIDRFDTWDAIEKANKINEAEPLKSALAQLSTQDGELLTGSRSMIATYQKDLSYLPVPPLGAKARYYEIRTMIIRPGHQTDFAEFMKLQNAAFAKAGIKHRGVVYSVTSGAPATTYLILTALESLKELDPQPNAMTRADMYGSTLERFTRVAQDSVVSNESTLFSINPKMSNPPKEYIEADKEFWAPKPKPAAAKPAAQ